MTTTCQRCGIDTVTGSLNCQDCLDVETDQAEAPAWGGRGPKSAEVDARMNDAIRVYRQRGMPDKKIAAALGVSWRTVLRRRQRMGLPGVPEAGRTHWTQESENRHALCKGAAHTCRDNAEKGSHQSAA